MKHLIVLGGLAAALALPLLAAPLTASASCADRKTTGTVIGGVGGALIGNSISRGGGGAIVGGLGGAVLGHEIARGGCSDYRRGGYATNSRHYRSGATRYRASNAGPQGQASTYYDQRGNPIGQGPACPTETQSYYDERGALVQRQVRTCAR